MSEKEVPSSVQQRIIIKFLTAEDINPSEIHTRLYSQFGEKCLSRTRVFEWAKEFRDGRDRVENEPHPRRPRTSVTPENINRIEHLILDNRRINVREVSEELGISIGSVENIIHNELKFSKVSARWVPRLLTPEQLEKRVEVSKQLLERYENEGEDFLDSIVTCDETWVHHFTPESKRSSMQWRRSGSPPPLKAKTFSSAGKVMATVFWDSKGVLFIDFLCGRKTINAQYYSNLLTEHVKPAIRFKRRRRQTSVCFLQDNARPHTAALTMETIRNLRWDVLPHPAYSPDLAPSDFHLFGPLKDFLGGRKFQSDEEVMAAVQNWTRDQTKNFYERGIKKLPERWKKCIELRGAYVEK